ncbi:hypothetical protein ABK040_008378 [Willaertia magna]
MFFDHQVNACILKYSDQFYIKIKSFFDKCNYIKKLKVIDCSNTTNNEEEIKTILSQSQLLLVPPNYFLLSDELILYITNLIDTNKLACVFFRGITTDKPLTKHLGYLNNNGYVEFGYASTFQIDYKTLLQQAELTKSFYLNEFLDKYGNEIKIFYESVKPEEISNTPTELLNIITKISPKGEFCTGIPLDKLSEPGKWICFANNFTYGTLRCAILVHTENKVLFNHWYAIEEEEEMTEFSKELTNTMIRYLLFDHLREKNVLLLKEKLRVRIVEDFKLNDVDITFN